MLLAPRRIPDSGDPHGCSVPTAWCASITTQPSVLVWPLLSARFVASLPSPGEDGWQLRLSRETRLAQQYRYVGIQSSCTVSKRLDQTLKRRNFSGMLTSTDPGAALKYYEEYYVALIEN